MRYKLRYPKNKKIYLTSVLIFLSISTTIVEVHASYWTGNMHPTTVRDITGYFEYEDRIKSDDGSSAYVDTFDIYGALELSDFRFNIGTEYIYQAVFTVEAKKGGWPTAWAYCTVIANGSDFFEYAQTENFKESYKTYTLTLTIGGYYDPDDDIQYWIEIYKGGIGYSTAYVDYVKVNVRYGAPF